MVIGLLTLAAIPTTIAICQGVARKDEPKDPKQVARELRKFTLQCWCEGASPGKSDIHKGEVVLGDGKMWVQSPKASPTYLHHPFEGFYINYPDEDRDPSPLGLVSMVTDNPPLMNWIYLSPGPSPVRHGNRTDSRPNRVGDWSNTAYEDDEVDEDEDPGGITFDGEEKFVAVQPPKGDTQGRWEVWWDENDDKLKGIKAVQGRLILRISLERKFLEEAKLPEEEEKKAEEKQAEEKKPEQSS